MLGKGGEAGHFMPRGPSTLEGPSPASCHAFHPIPSHPTFLYIPVSASSIGIIAHTPSNRFSKTLHYSTDVTSA